MPERNPHVTHTIPCVSVDGVTDADFGCHLSRGAEGGLVAGSGGAVGER
ncbi:hypothetical protein [Streptomyces sp. NPDC048489]